MHMLLQWHSNFSFVMFSCICFQEAVKLKPTFADAYLNQGNVYKVSDHVLSTKIRLLQMPGLLSGQK